jgi:hypothetical protein
VNVRLPVFSIRVVPSSEPPAFSRHLGQIVIGDFSETFAIGFPSSVVCQLEARWKAELRRLVEGAPAVMLIHDPRLAWVIWREGDHCYVQQVLSADGTFSDTEKRETLSEDGHRISEWTIAISEMSRFVEA